MQINFIKEINILSVKFKIEWDKKCNGGEFSWKNGIIKIGCECSKTDPGYTLSVISHEVMEVILSGMGARFYNGRIDGNYLFNFSHQTFENAIQVHTEALLKFIKQ